MFKASTVRKHKVLYNIQSNTKPGKKKKKTKAESMNMYVKTSLSPPLPLSPLSLTHARTRMHARSHAPTHARTHTDTHVRTYVLEKHITVRLMTSSAVKKL